MGSEAISLLHLEHVVGSRLDLGLKLMAQRVELLSIGICPQLVFLQIYDFKPVEDDVLDIEKIQKFIEPGDQKSLFVISADLDLAADRVTNPIKLGNQAEHGIGCGGEDLLFILAISDDADIGGMVDNLEVIQINTFPFKIISKDGVLCYD